MTITICAGSCCHHRQSEEMIPFLQSLIKRHNLEEKILLKASFCMGRCSEGFNLMIDEEIKTFNDSVKCSSYLEDIIEKMSINGSNDEN